METETYGLEWDVDLEPSPVRPALIWAEGIAPPLATQTYPAFLVESIENAKRTGETAIPPETRQRVRRMLRFGKYRASGRGKPASEFLLRAALDDAFPSVNGPVNVNNAISLESGFPGSIFDEALSGRRLLLRRGRVDESYVFNPSGQSIDLRDLLLVCRRSDSGWQPCGNPVKDSMATKIRPETKNVLAILYVPIDEPEDSAKRWAARYAELLHSHCLAHAAGFAVVQIP